MERKAKIQLAREVRISCRSESPGNTKTLIEWRIKIRIKSSLDKMVRIVITNTMANSSMTNKSMMHRIPTEEISTKETLKHQEIKNKRIN